MTEVQWVSQVVDLVRPILQERDRSLEIGAGERLPYANEVISYRGSGPEKTFDMSYQTDILVTERLGADEWKPRLIVEAKLARINTHDAITYSQKAATHKNVHPFLRYGIFLGERKHYPLPGRLFRHGAHFDFMLSWSGLDPTQEELARLVSAIVQEVEASRTLEEILFNSRRKDRARYTYLHRPLHLAD